MKSLVSTPDQLNAKSEWFEDSSRVDNEGPFLIVHGSYYADPMKIRALALKQQFFRYSPPIGEQVGEQVAAQDEDTRPASISTSLLRYHENSE